MKFRITFISLPALCLVGGSATTVVGLLWRLLDQTRVSNPEQALVQQEQGIALASTLESIGFGNLGASWLWLNLVQYYGHEDRQETGYGLAPTYLDAITTLDPYFTNAYLFASALTIQAGQAEQARELLLRGVNYITPAIDPANAYKLYIHLAFTDILFLGNLETGRDFYYKAADWFEQANLGSGDDLRTLADRVVNSPDTDWVRFRLWKQLYDEINDLETRQWILINHLIPTGQVIRGPNGEIQDIVPPEIEGSRSLP